jgi:hypothetical protein
MFTVLDNAYMRKAYENPKITIKHQKILFILLHEKKYYEKGELLGLTNNSLEELDELLLDLEKTGLITVEGWLVKIADHTKLFAEEIKEKSIVRTRNKK